MPLVSIIMPTYNRADTIKRAIDSVKAQTFQDWELIVIDDGSEDDTYQIVPPMDSRIVFIRQQNQRLAGARNTGLRASQGEYIAFLDSDDEWLPHHLELCMNFFKEYPQEDVVSAELLECFDEKRFVKHYYLEASDTYPTLAKRVKSSLLNLPPGESDAYLRIYESRQPIGEWGNAIVERTESKETFHYRGNIFEKWRFGWLLTSQPMVITRRAFEKVGYLDTTFAVAGDFGWLASLCKHFPVNYLSIPTCIKHENAGNGNALAQQHIVKGKSENAYAKDMLRWFDELFWLGNEQDSELTALRGFRQYYIAETALRAGLRDEALLYLQQAQKSFPRFWHARFLRWIVKLVSNGESARRMFDLLTRSSYTWHLLLRHEITLGALFYKAIHKIGEHADSTT